MSSVQQLCPHFWHLWAGCIQIPEQISGVREGEWGSQERERQRQNSCMYIRERIERDLKNRVLVVYFCVREKGREEEKTEKEKGEDRLHSPLRRSYSLCHVVSTPSTGESGRGGNDPICPSLSCASPFGVVLWMPVSSSKVAL